MAIVRSHNGVPIRLTDERWQHVVEGHPEMKTLRETVLEVLAEPEMIQEGDFGELPAIRFCHQTPLTRKYLVVVYREISSTDGFIITAYLTSAPSGRRAIRWMR